MLAFMLHCAGCGDWCQPYKMHCQVVQSCQPYSTLYCAIVPVLLDLVTLMCDVLSIMELCAE